MAKKVPDEIVQEVLKTPPLISHDLRSALSDVTGGLELIDVSALSEENRMHLERALASSKSLARMMTSLTESLRDFGGDTLTDADPFLLEGFLKDLTQRWAARASAKNLSFNVDVGASMPERLHLDRTMLDRILSNLLENAIKFCAVGQVHLSLGIEEDWLTIVVRDTGKGFTPAALEKLYEFKGRPHSSGMPGTGLGLHIVKRLVDQMRGEINVFNSASGAMVVLRFPKATWYSSVVPLKIRKHQSILKDQRVLLAEDNETSQLVLKRMIEDLGAELVVASDGVEALKLFYKEPFDIVFLDVEMPRKSGLDVIRDIRSLPDKRAKVPVIAVTAFVMPEHEEQILAAGANGTIAKPVTDGPYFARMVEDILLQEPLILEAPQLDAKPTPDRYPLEEATYAALVKAVGDSQMSVLLDKILDDLLSVQYRLTDALQNADISELRSQTHVLISVAGAVGARNLQSMAQRLNLDANNKNYEELKTSAPDCLGDLRALIAEIKRRKQNYVAVRR